MMRRLDDELVVWFGWQNIFGHQQPGYLFLPINLGVIHSRSKSWPKQDEFIDKEMQHN